MKKISLIVPCYNEEKALPFFYDAICNVSKNMKDEDFEFIFIDDGSKDETLSVLRDYSQKDERVKYISFSKNFGKEAAIYAGMKKSTGDFVVAMDADMQHPPSMLPQMYDYVKNGEYDCAATRRISRKGEPPIRSFFARMFYKIINKISNADIVDGATDFRLMTRQMTDAVISLAEYNRFSKGIFSWVGFKTKWIPFENVERVAGETKWSFWNLLLYSLEGITAFSTVPLLISSVAGIFFCFIALIIICFVIFKKIYFGDPVQGWASLVCIMLFSSGVQLFFLGVIGNYLAKTYLECKKRPIYIIRETEEKNKQ